MVLNFLIFDSSNAVLGMAFTPLPLEKVIAFCTAEMKIVLQSKQNKNKDSRIRLKTSKVVKKGGKKSSLLQASAGFRDISQHLT